MGNSSLLSHEKRYQIEADIAATLGIPADAVMLTMDGKLVYVRASAIQDNGSLGWSGEQDGGFEFTLVPEVFGLDNMLERSLQPSVVMLP